MKLGIIYDDRKTEAKALAMKTKTWLENKGYAIRDNAINSDFIITFGGDGFILQIANEIVSKNLSIPIIRVNLGHIGALANIEPEEIFERLQQFLSGDYIIKKRTRIKAEIYSDTGLKILTQKIDALNEIVIERLQTKVISFEIVIDSREKIERSGDGIIFATQTGSTAYNHATGGQVLVKDRIVFSVISPNQSEGGLIKPITSIFKISKIEGEARLVADGNEVMSLSEDKVVIIKKSEKDTYFVEIGDIERGYGEDLLEKLADLEHKQWGEWTRHFLEFYNRSNRRRWERQSHTAYKNLSEEEKESDRVWARKVLEIMNRIEK